MNSPTVSLLAQIYAFVIGACGGVGCYFAVSRLKARFGYDDSLDVFGVHGVGSAVGLLLLGLVADASVNAAIGNTYQSGGHAISLAGSAMQFSNQARGVLFAAGLAALGTFMILKLVDAVMGLRVSAEDEDSGLDLTQHGESAYND